MYAQRYIQHFPAAGEVIIFDRSWYDYSQARDAMFEATDTDYAPWYIVRSDDKKRARLNCISHLLSLIPYEKVPHEQVKLPKRSNQGKYDDQATLEGRRFVPAKRLVRACSATYSGAAAPPTSTPDV